MGKLGETLNRIMSVLRAAFLLSFFLPTLGTAVDFRPEFVAVRSPNPLTTTPRKLTEPVYNLFGWKSPDGKVERDIFGTTRA